MTPEATSGTDTETGAAARAYFDALAERDLDAMAACWKPGTIDRLVGMADLRVPEGLREWFGAIFEAMPDFQLDVLDTVVEGDKAAVRWRARGTFNGTGKVEGVAPTGNSIDLEGFDLITVEDGKIVSNDAYVNGMEMARQMGVMPPAGSAAERAMLGASNARTAARDKIRSLLDR